MMEENVRMDKAVTVIIVARNSKYGVICSDTRLTFPGLFDEPDDDERKVLYLKRHKSFLCGYNASALGNKFFDKIKDISRIDRKIIDRIFDDAYNECLNERFFSIEDLECSAIFLLTRNTLTENKSPEILALQKSSDGSCINQFNQNSIFVFPPIDYNKDINHKKYDRDFIKNANLKRLLLPCIEYFIDCSENSKYVSSTCCFGIINSIGSIRYFEDNMYNIREKLTNEKLPRNNLWKLIKYQKKRF